MNCQDHQGYFLIAWAFWHNAGLKPRSSSRSTKFSSAVIGEAVRGAAVETGRQFAAQEPGGTSVASFVALQALWEKDDALEVDVLQVDAEHYDYNVKRCSYAEMYHAMGLGEIGHLLSCARDSHFITGYDARIHLTRTTTIMQGGGRCDFRYRLVDKAAGDEPHE
jgi:hypothetical protein